MCLNTRLIRNRYTSRSLRVSCGKCPACLQTKALGISNRIRNEASLDKIALFVTLTYENRFIPYIKRSDLSLLSDKVTVYRDVTINSRGNEVLGTVSLGEYDLPERIHSSDIVSLKDLKGYSGKVGVCYFSDVQNFFKKLRINLARKYDFHETFSAFKCSEYGGSSHRPHFHLLIYIKPDYEEIFRSAILESWSFGNKYESGKFIEVARDAASYVASYVNCGYNVSRILSETCFRQKHSYSKVFGVHKECFSLPEVLSKVRRQDLHYFGTKVDFETGSFASYVIPKYVINRYFPKFAGYSRLTDDEILRVLSCPSYLFGFTRLLGLVSESVRRCVVRLYNCQKYYCEVTGLSVFDYARDFLNVWTCFESTVLKDSYFGVQHDDFYEFYDNLDEYLVRSKFSDTIYLNIPSLNLQEYGFRPNLFKLDVNSHLHRIRYDAKMTDLFRKKTKQKDVTNNVMSRLYNV